MIAWFLWWLRLLFMYIVFGKISSDYKKLTFMEEETISDHWYRWGASVGWNERQAWMTVLSDEKSFVENQWKDIDGFLAIIWRDGFWAVGQLRQQGRQIYTFNDTKGYLKTLRWIWIMFLERPERNLDSLYGPMRAFWRFLKRKGEGACLRRFFCYKRLWRIKFMVLEGNISREDRQGIRVAWQVTMYIICLAWRKPADAPFRGRKYR